MPRASIPARAALDTVERTRAAGYRAYKIKVGFGEETDLGSLRPGGRSELKAGERLMVDVNQGWDLATACRMAPKLAEFGLDWIEEPLPADRPTRRMDASRRRRADAGSPAARICAVPALSRTRSIRASSASSSPMPPNGAAIPAACPWRGRRWRPAAAIAHTSSAAPSG